MKTLPLHTPQPRAATAWPARIRRLCLLGGESAGKTTLAQALAHRLGTTWVAEYGRERWLDIGGTFSLDELLAVAQEQVAREEGAAAGAKGWLVCDTSPLTTLVYALLDHGSAPAELTRLARRPYDLVLLCAPDFAFVQDGARRDASFRADQHALTLRTLADLGHAHVLVHGSLEARVAQVLVHIAAIDARHATTARTVAA